MVIYNYDTYILLKLILSIYVVWTSTEENKISLIVVLFVITYIIVIFLKGILENSKFYFKSLSIIEGTLIFIFSIKYIPIASLMLSILLLEYFIKEKKNIYMVTFSFLPLICILKSSGFKNAIIILTILIILLINNQKKNNKINNLDLVNDDQRKRIYNLQKKLSEERDIQEQVLYTARLEERNKISARLHDKIGHTISGTLLQLEASKIVFKNDKEKGLSMIDSCTENLRKGMEEIRMTLRNIKPVEEELGINRIRKILDEKIKDTNIKGKLIYNGDLDKVNSKMWIVFIHIITELTTNSIKYSNGNLIQVKIEILNKFIKLEVSDNGFGCEKIQKGIGLKNIEESVLNLNGKLIINSDDNFTVIVLIPV